MEATDLLNSPESDNEGLAKSSHRDFYDALGSLPRQDGLTDDPEAEPAMSTDFVKHINQGIVGQLSPFMTPFGEKRMLYADWTASGKSLSYIEDYVRQNVLPFYGNTHTTTSITGLQSTCFRLEARQIIAQSVNAKITGRAAEDVVLFTGPGTTTAVNRLVDVLGLRRPKDANKKKRPVVFIGPHEHHSNMLPWRESAADVVTIKEDTSGGVDLEHLKAQLSKYTERPLKIGAFAAASNITGIIAPVDAITELLHRHGALSFWDYATAAPYLPIDMNPVNVPAESRPFVYKDAIYFSCHKFLGGPGSPGILVVKKRLLGNEVPTLPGGGTVFYVTKSDHRYLSNREEREEGGTPDIVGSIRAGLVLQLKDKVGEKRITALERMRTTKVMDSLRRNPRIVFLGSHEKERLPIFTFLIRCNGRFLHYNFVCALLNDLYGIQTRGGCQCAGPYGQRLLGIDRASNLEFESLLLDKLELVRPGFTRLSFPYFLAEEEVDFILAAIEQVAEYGWRLLPHYRFNYKTGEWKHHSRLTRFPERKWLSKFDYEFSSGDVRMDEKENVQGNHLRAAYFEETLREALEVMKSSKGAEGARQVNDQSRLLSDEVAGLRWFVLPSEATEALTAEKRGDASKMEFFTSLTRLSEVFCIRPHEGLQEEDEMEEEREEDQQEMDGSNDYQKQTDKEEVSSEDGSPPIFVCPLRPKARAPTTRAESTKYPLRTVDEQSLHAKRETEQLQKTLTAVEHVSEKIKKAVLFPKPPHKIMRAVGQAIAQWDMIHEGDRLMVGLSGGKDSLTLLHVLYQLQRRSPVKFHLAAVTVDPCTPSYDPSPLKGYMETLGIPYFYLKERIIERAEKEMEGDSLCAYCSRMKRGLLYSCCRKEGYNKLVLGQHLDDLVESLFMSAMHNGQVRTMKANYKIQAGDIQVIRPLAYVREHETKKFAQEARLPVINENCPACFEQPKERHRIKKMLAKEESLFPDIFGTMRKALVPLMDEAMYPLMNQIVERVESRSQQNKRRKPASSSVNPTEAREEAKRAEEEERRRKELLKLLIDVDEDTLRAELERRKAKRPRIEIEE